MSSRGSQVSGELLSRCSTGIEGLDEVSNGGLLANRLYLVDGNPGSGKTTLGLQFLMEGVKQGERCLYITLSETEKELRSSALSHGWDLDGIEIKELIAQESELELEAQVTLFSPVEVELSETTSKILAMIDELNPHRVVFDSLSELRLLGQSTLRYRRQILSLKQYFFGRDCTVIMLDDRTAEGPDMQLQSIAHGVISLEQKVPDYGAPRRNLRIVKLRGSSYRGGHHDFAITTGGIVVFPRLLVSHTTPSKSMELVESEIPRLDALLGGGLNRGTSTLLIGPAGSGKSTVAVQFIVSAAERDDQAAIFLFDEAQQTLELRCRNVGIDLTSQIERGKVMIRALNPSEVSPGEFSHMVKEAVEKHGARAILIDSLNGYITAMTDTPSLVPQLHELLSFLARAGVTTLMVVAQQGMIGTMASPGGIDTSYLADTVILHRFFEYKGHVKKAISVVKKRSGIHEETIRELRFSSEGIHVGEPLDQLRGILTGVPIELNDRANR